MNNKLLIEELKRVNEIMGVKVPHNLIVEAWEGALQKLILKMARQLPRIVDSAAFVKLFEDPKLYKKFKDLFGEATNNKEMIEAINRNYGSFAADRAVKRLLLQNRETRAIVLEIIIGKTGKQGLNKYTNLDMLKLMIKELNDMGLPMTTKDFLKVTDDYFYKNVDGAIMRIPWIQGFSEKKYYKTGRRKGVNTTKNKYSISLKQPRGAYLTKEKF